MSLKEAVSEWIAPMSFVRQVQSVLLNHCLLILYICIPPVFSCLSISLKSTLFSSLVCGAVVSGMKRSDCCCLPLMLVWSGER